MIALREAGAIMVGKTVTTEFAATHPGVTRNPTWIVLSGSAALPLLWDLGMLAGATGSQVIGSIFALQVIVALSATSPASAGNQPGRQLRRLQPELYRHDRRQSRRMLVNDPRITSRQRR